LELNGIPGDMQALKRKRDEVEIVNKFAQLERPGVKRLNVSPPSSARG
jgi:hypothetical protein